MRLRFKKTDAMERYQGFHEGEPVNFSDGEEKDVPDAKGEQLLENYPEFFTKVKGGSQTEEAETPAVNRAIRDSKSRGRILRKKK